jgi:hypothetical protein
LPRELIAIGGGDTVVTQHGGNPLHLPKIVALTLRGDFDW